MTEFRNIFSISVSPNAEGARQARKSLQAEITDTDIPDECRDGLMLATAEWITNLGQHPEHTSNQVNVVLTRVGGTLVFEINDDGSPFETFHQTLLSVDGPPKLDETGMGLKLMAKYFPAMTYVQSRNNNRLRLQHHIDTDNEKTTVLLVDDDPIILQLYGEYLNETYRTLLADSVDEALQILKRTPIDLIISDIRMPNGASGLDLCAIVRDDHSLGTIPFVFLTGDKNIQTLETAQGLAIDDYLLKPVRKTALLSCAGRIIQNALFIRNRLGDRFDEDLTRLLQPLLPSRLGPYNTAVHSQSAEAGGGDLLFHHRRDTETLIVLADLMGHGSQAKFYSHALAGYLSGMLAALEKLSPEVVLSSLNRAFAEDAHLTNTIATAVVLLISDDGRVRISNAGHPKPLLVGSRAAEHLPTSGSLLGLSLDTAFESHEFSLIMGQRIFLYTDGLSEIGDTPETHENNFSQIRSILKETAAMGISDAALKVEQCIDRLLTEQPRDDLTFVLLEYAG
jgi:phosphoserine phosphatase RsbU/P